MITRIPRVLLALAALCSVALATGAAAAPESPAGASPPAGRFIVVAKSPADLALLRADVVKAGGKVEREMPDTDALVVSGAPAGFKAQVAASGHAQAVAKDGVRTLIRPSQQQDLFGTTQLRERHDLGAPGRGRSVTPDPAFSLPGLLWNVLRIGADRAWKVTLGSPAVTVGVADTGLDFTHKELARKIANVVDLTASENPPICKTYFGASDDDMAAYWGGPATTDWNGHGSWIGGNIAAALDGQGINGIAPRAKLVSLKISQWCGYAWDSTILDAFNYAADHRIDVVSISLGGYLDRADPDQEAIYQQYVRTVARAWRKGTVIVAAAGNEHVRIGAGGLVMSHYSLTAPGTPSADFYDYYGMYEVPGGIPLVVTVASTGNVVNAPASACPAGTTGTSATCKPTGDAHQPTGVGEENQLAYYSNYGPRIDVAAPGGARKFNLPVWDRGGTPGFPVTDADSTAAWEDFSITSNWALEIPCYYNLGLAFPADQCYSTIQGTSMATPHASAALALIASASPAARHRPALLVERLKSETTRVSGNTTPPLSATDTSAGDLAPTGDLCSTGYCHLGGSAIPDEEAYGAGLVNAFAALRESPR